MTPLRSPNRVLSLLSARDGFLWIGTRRGVVRFDGREFVVAGRSTHQVFTSEECTSLAEDREGRIWVGTTDGMLLLEDEPRRFDLSAVRLPGEAPDAISYSGGVMELLVGPQ